MKELPLRGFQFQGYVGKRRVVSYGWQYDFNERKLRQAEDITDRVGAQHSWVDALRYSITFRNFRADLVSPAS